MPKANVAAVVSPRALLMAGLLAASSLALAGCNTTAGAGEDVSAAGHAVSNSAEKVKSGL